VGVEASHLEELLRELALQPDDVALRERAARSLATAGRADEAASLLSSRLVNIAQHEASPLPCLCAACVAGTPARATLGAGAFVRDFVVTSGKVLHFWFPEEMIPRLNKLRRAVEASLRDRLLLQLEERAHKAKTKAKAKAKAKSGGPHAGGGEVAGEAGDAAGKHGGSK
jgi:hypothetical protein